MSELDPKLVQEIARLVVARMSSHQSAAASAGPPPQADVRPPAGICTGDYSKFPELAARPVGAKPQASPPPEAAPTSPATPAPASEPAPLTGIITAGQLQQAVAAASDGVARLAADARLSPLAADFVREHPEKVRRLGHVGGGSGASADKSKSSAGKAADAWTWWIEGHCPAVQALVNRPGTNLRPSPQSHVSSALTRVVHELADAIKSKRTLGGILFVPSAAKVMCLANRCPSLRAVLGTCGQAVEQGVTDLGANVLVIEYPHIGPAKMEQMLERFTSQPPTATPMLERQLADLHRCG
jgi:ribose 5-phosphate isomerase RpiB